MPDLTIDKLLDRIKVLESALKEINNLYKNMAFKKDGERDFWKCTFEMDEIARKALWLV